MALMRAFKVPYHAYFRMLLNHGLHGADRILSRPAVELMTTNRLTPEQTVAREAMAREAAQPASAPATFRAARSCTSGERGEEIVGKVAFQTA